VQEQVEVLEEEKEEENNKRKSQQVGLSTTPIASKPTRGRGKGAKRKSQDDGGSTTTTTSARGRNTSDTTQDLDQHITCYLVMSRGQTELPDLNEMIPEDNAEVIQVTQNAPE
jgi:hypothetical protein